MSREHGGWDGKPGSFETFAAAAGTYPPGTVLTWDAVNNRFQEAAALVAGALVVPFGNLEAGYVIDDDDDQIVLQTGGNTYVICDAAMDANTDVVPSDVNLGQVRAYNVATDTVDEICGRMLEPVTATLTSHFLMQIKR